ncbi:hypothetical protein [Bacillus alkalicellulosilyticus]|uniref:hypothetical protein n=1 Tax=Alkalihalobacterium alkalicellulosilyticum TaxID=1912214 RepID=UPI00099750FE|nr:hypothetical protein [Bacillus alkalicellulosilyticus]
MLDIILIKKSLYLSFIAVTLFLFGCGTGTNTTGDAPSTKERYAEILAAMGEDYSEEDIEKLFEDYDENFLEEFISLLEKELLTEKGEEDPITDFTPEESDIVLKDDTLTNIDLLENFIAVAGEKGNDNESQIRIVKYVPQGIQIYDLKSSYDEEQDQRWISVTPDMSYYTPSEDDVQDVFNNASQQCNYMEKDTESEEWFYKLYECRTNWEYRILPVIHDI